jgi:hypothetical protein
MPVGDARLCLKALKKQGSNCTEFPSLLAEKTGVVQYFWLPLSLFFEQFDPHQQHGKETVKHTGSGE